MLSHTVRHQPSRMCTLSPTVLLYEDRRRTPCEIRWLDCCASPPKPVAGKSVTFTKQDAVWDMCCVKDNDDEDLLVTTRGYVGIFAYKLKTDERLWRVKGRRATKKGKEIGVESITTDGRGHLFVCGLDECVWIFSTSGNFLATLMRQKSLDTVQPWSISWCRETSSLVVAHTKANDRKYHFSNIKEILETQPEDAREKATETQPEVVREMTTETQREGARKNTTNATDKAEQFLSDLRQELYARSSSAVKEHETPALEELEMSTMEENTENLLTLREKLLEELAQVPDSEKEVTTTDDSQNTMAEDSPAEADAGEVPGDAAVENRDSNVPATAIEEDLASVANAGNVAEKQENLRAGDGTDGPSQTDLAVSNTGTETAETTQESQSHALNVHVPESTEESANAVNVVQFGNDAQASTKATTTADEEFTTEEETVPETSALVDPSTRGDTPDTNEASATVENSTATTVQSDGETTELHSLETTKIASAVSIPEGPIGQRDKQAVEMEQDDFEEGEICDTTANTDTVTSNDAHKEPMDTTETASLGRVVTSSGETAEKGPDDAASTEDARREETNLSATVNAETTGVVADEVQELAKDGMEIEEDNNSATETVNPAVGAVRDEQEATTSAVAETTVSATAANESSETMEDSSEIAMDTSVTEEVEKNSEVTTRKDAKAVAVGKEVEKTGQKSLSSNYKGKTLLVFPLLCCTPLNSHLSFTIIKRHIPLLKAQRSSLVHI